MKILIRNKNTSEFIKETGIYTSSLDEAVDFLSQELAVDFYEKHRLKEHEILVTRDDD